MGSERNDGYFRVSNFIGHNDKIATLPSDHVRWTLILVWAAGKLQDPIGQWVSLDHLRACVQRPMKHFLALIDAGLIEAFEDKICCHDFGEWQTPRRRDPTNAERQSRHRRRVAEASTTTRRSVYDDETKQRRTRKDNDLAQEVTLRNVAVTKASNAYTETETKTTKSLGIESEEPLESCISVDASPAKEAPSKPEPKKTKTPRFRQLSDYLDDPDARDAAAEVIARYGPNRGKSILDAAARAQGFPSAFTRSLQNVVKTRPDDPEAYVTVAIREGSQDDVFANHVKEHEQRKREKPIDLEDIPQ
ncbi:MAG TPA: hypothetical protein VGA18_08575 [Rhodothermales bacterium]